MSMRNWVDQWIKVKGWQVWIFRLDEDHVGRVIPKERKKRLSKHKKIRNMSEEGEESDPAM